MIRGLSPFRLPLLQGLMVLLVVACASAQSQSQPPDSGEPARDNGEPAHNDGATAWNDGAAAHNDRAAARNDGAATAVGAVQTDPIPGKGQEDERPGVAVWPFTNGGSFGRDPWDYDALEVGLQQMLITELAQNSELRLVNRGRLREIIEELELSETGYVAPGTTAEVGRLVGARYMVVGSFVDADGTMRLDVRLDNVETGEILTETAGKVQGDREEVLDLLVDLSGMIVESADLPPLPQEVVEERKSVSLSGEGVMLYSLALTQEDLGNHEEAIQLYRRVISDAPDYTPARERLVQLGGGAP